MPSVHSPIAVALAVAGVVLLAYAETGGRFVGPDAPDGWHLV